jgi:ACS family tartrate transporter-like MFS transporter
MSLVSGPNSFYAMRLLLGVAEAGFFPGIILYLTYWFPAATRARMVSLFMVAVPIANVIGAPASGALLGLEGFAGLTGWQWLFIIEGVPAVILGFVALAVLTDRPERAAWLTEPEREALVAQLAAEAEATREAGYAGLVQGLTRPRVLGLGALYFCMVIGLYGIGFWMPQVIQRTGLSHLEVGFLTSIPYLFAAIAMVLWGWHSDRTGERTWHVALPLFLSAGAFAWSAFSGSLPATMVALTLATIGIYAAIGPFWSFPTALLTGTAAAAGLALVNSIGNSGGLVAPSVVGWLKDATGTFTAPLLFLSGALALGGVLAVYISRGVSGRKWTTESGVQK